MPTGAGKWQAASGAATEGAALVTDNRDPPPSELGSVLSGSLRRLAARGALIRFARGERLIEEGGRGDTLYIVISGRVRAFSRDDRGREITFGTYAPGEYVGEMSLDGGPRSASVEAVEPTLCAMVTRLTLTRHIAEDPEFAFALLAKVIGRARAATLSAKQLALNDVYGRLKALLESLADDVSGGVRPIAQRLTHRDLSRRVGASPSMITRLMKDLEQGGYLRTDKAGIALLRPLPARW